MNRKAGKQDIAFPSSISESPLSMNDVIVKMWASVSGTLRLVALSTLIISDCCCLCPDGWVYFRTSCYLFSRESLSYTEAEHYCEQHKSHLVIIESKDENTFLKSFASALKDSNHWIGLTDTEIVGIWKWVDDSTLIYSDWSPGAPNGGAIGNCAMLWKYSQYTWVDEPCSRAYNPLCERPEAGSEVIVG